MKESEAFRKLGDYLGKRMMTTGASNPVIRDECRETIAQMKKLFNDRVKGSYNEDSHIKND